MVLIPTLTPRTRPRLHQVTNATFSEFLESEHGPGQGVFDNEYWRASNSSILPKPRFPSGKPPEPSPSPGAYFWVQHAFKEDMADHFWKALKSLDADAQVATPRLTK